MSNKIVNIGHADNVHIDVPGLFETVDKLDQVIADLPELIETTIATVIKNSAPDNPFDSIRWDDDFSIPLTPVTLESKQEDAYKLGDIVMSHWQIDRWLGNGSFSTVYEAHHIDHGILYRSAIKVIHSALRYHSITNTDDFTHLTLNGSHILQQELDNLVELKGTGYIVEYEDHEKREYNDGSWDVIIRMELLQPLSNVLLSKALSREEIIRLGIDICKALEFCNKCNIIHCDVKPSNIYLSKWGGYKLGDFSASTKIGDRKNLDQIGTLKYMAPEVYGKKPFTSNIDIYSLGLVLYQLMNDNRMPFESKMASERIKETALLKRLSGAPLPLIPGLDQSLQSIILKACAYDPEKRFSTATEMLNELLKLNDEKLHIK